MIGGASLLDALPEPSDRRLAIKVTPDALRRIRGRHPWVYDRSIESVNHDDGAPGDIARIVACSVAAAIPLARRDAAADSCGWLAQRSPSVTPDSGRAHGIAE